MPGDLIALIVVALVAIIMLKIGKGVTKLLFIVGVIALFIVYIIPKFVL